jgi:lipoprotein NlpD
MNKKLLSYQALLATILASLLLSACVTRKSTTGYNPQAPVEDRRPTIGPNAAAQSTVAINTATKALPGIENAGKPGYYSVKSGDTLIRIGLDNGQNWRDIARWNQLDRPSQIEVGQVLRVVPPANAIAAAPVRAAPAAAPVADQSVAVATPVPMPGSGMPNPVVITPVTTPATPVVAPAKTAVAADELNWTWPTLAGTVLAGFDEVKNKGLDIGGNAGDSVLAAFDGRVVYAGSGLRGYGNLVILKHNDTFLSAYAHNQTLLVKEDQSVIKGQKIAEMGQSDADRVKLHFEIRKQGKPVDPAQYLPKR